MALKTLFNMASVTLLIVVCNFRQFHDDHDKKKLSAFRENINTNSLSYIEILSLIKNTNKFNTCLAARWNTTQPLQDRESLR